MKSIKWLAFLVLALGSINSYAQEKIRVFQLNMWQGGAQVPNGFEQIVDKIIESDADIVTLSEVRNLKGLIAALAAKNHTYYSHSAGGAIGCISKFPIKKSEVVSNPKKSNIFAYHLELPNKKEMIVCSAHLEYTHYAVFLPRGYDGNSFKPIKPDSNGKPTPITDLKKLHAMDKNSTRDEAIKDFVAYSKKHPQANIILAGDFNEASHLDWTKATANLYSHNGVAIEWGNSKTLLEAGFIDSYREINPNPVTHPGFTWSSENSGNRVINWTPMADDRERIDFIYYNQKNLKATKTYVAGSKKYYVKGILTQSAKFKDLHLLEDGSKWPSDHKGVITDFDFTP